MKRNLMLFSMTLLISQFGNAENNYNEIGSQNYPRVNGKLLGGTAANEERSDFERPVYQPKAPIVNQPIPSEPYISSEPYYSSPIEEPQDYQGGQEIPQAYYSTPDDQIESLGGPYNDPYQYGKPIGSNPPYFQDGSYPYFGTPIDSSYSNFQVEEGAYSDNYGSYDPYPMDGQSYSEYPSDYSSQYEEESFPEYMPRNSYSKNEGFNYQWDDSFIDNPDAGDGQEYQDPTCPCRYYRYEPEWYYTWKYENEKRYTYKRHCRYVPQYYQKRCCVYVPQYYYVTRAIYIPEYYYSTKAHDCPRLVCQPRMRYVPRYYYKSCPETVECDMCDGMVEY